MSGNPTLNFLSVRLSGTERRWRLIRETVSARATLYFLLLPLSKTLLSDADDNVVEVFRDLLVPRLKLMVLLLDEFIFNIFFIVRVV